MQLLGYMERLNEKKGYLLAFDFRDNPQQFESGWREESGRVIFESRVYGN